MDEIRQTIIKLINSEESSYSISKNTGINASQIQRIRSNQINIDNVSFANIEKLYQYATKNLHDQ